jgi:UDP-N-acetylmuramoylalanine--D-glutamate ligase
MDTFEDFIKNKKVLVFGLGRQGGGTGDREWLLKHKAIVRVSDADTALVPEGQTKEQIDWAEVILKNPGVSDEHDLIVYARTLNKPVLTSIAVFVKYASIKTIGVTGTRGKSTTTALIKAVLEAAFPGQIISGGNIPGTSGLALFDEEVSLPAQAGKKYAVLELSSFQLHNFHDLAVSPNYAILTNIYPDHLNRYKDMDTYAYDKSAIHLYQKPGDFYLEYPSAETVMDWETSLPGIHNRENIAGMWGLAQHLGIPEELCRKVVKDFSGLPYRLEIIREVGGVTYINDTTSTTPIAATKALQSLTKPTIWITGGDSKNLPYDELLVEVKTNQYLRQVIILGSKNIPEYVSQLKEILGDKVIGQVHSMSDAVALAVKSSASGDIVLLSPGFASFDLFKNEFDRGDQFNAIVRGL